MFPEARHKPACLLFVLILLASLPVAPLAVRAAPAGFAPGSYCVALAPAGTPVATLSARREAWDCSGKDWPLSGNKASFVRIDMGGVPVPTEDRLTTRLTLFDRLSITAIGVDGTMATRDIPTDALSFSTTGWRMHMPLPQLGRTPVAAYVLEVSGARHVGLLTDIGIGPPRAPERVSRSELVLAGLCGLMIMPLVFNFAFYRVLRQRFALWHALAVFGMLVQTVVASGIVNRFASLSIHDLSALSSLSWFLTITAASYFFTGLLEPGMLRPIQSRLLYLSAPWIGAASLYYYFASGPLLPSIAPVYYASFLPFIFVLTWSMVTAARRGSRTVWFQIVGWTPMMVMGLVRIASMLGATQTPMGLMVVQHLAIAFEVMITTLGAADRFMAIKDQRDQALAHSRILEALAARDPLTGLYNRRGFEQRFGELVAEGYDTMALLDLDHFKAINDSRGHATGDLVLQIVGRTLEPDADTVAVRLGGEEFLLLMRGARAAERAERRRLAIPTCIAREIPGLGRPVTASMGLVHFARGTTFDTLFAGCDRLLYAAKAAGRDRTETGSATDALSGEARASLA